MKCPECGAELPQGAVVCPQCGAALDDGDAAARDDQPAFVTVFETTTSAEIAVARGLLEAEGISCRADGAGEDDIAGLDQLTGLMRIQVAPEDAEAARALLDERPEPEPESADE
jgi:hypothetical protein